MQAHHGQTIARKNKRLHCLRLPLTVSTSCASLLCTIANMISYSNAIPCVVLLLLHDMLLTTEFIICRLCCIIQPQPNPSHKLVFITTGYTVPNPVTT